MMTVHVLHAGDGYTYLTRQVASADRQLGRDESLTDYYMQHGNPPGQWVGEGIGDVGVSGEVREHQMKSLFGLGMHPEAETLGAAALAAGASKAEATKEARLGRRYPEYHDPEDGFRAAMDEAFSSFRAEHDRPPRPGAERDGIRWQVATEMVRASSDGGRVTDAEVKRYLANRGAEERKAVAGYDLVFTPVKSISVLWGLGGDEVRQQITEAHKAAWKEAFEWVQSEAALTRIGAGGVAQLETNGFLAVAFDHLDSRTGDPNLHTHVAVANKVRGVDGKWRSIDGRVLHALGVAASERYNSTIEAQVRTRLGVQFAPEARSGGREPVREIVGIREDVREKFSRRRASIEGTYDALLQDYRDRHGHEPDRTAQFRLAQRATLETRPDKVAPGGLADRVGQWRAEAIQVLGSAQELDAMLDHVLRPDPATGLEPRSVEDLADEVVAKLAARRGSWNEFHILAEAQRVARGQVTADMGQAAMVAEVVAAVRGECMSLTPPEANEPPPGLSRSDGTSVYRVHGAEMFTHSKVTDAEWSLVDAALKTTGLSVPTEGFERAVEQVSESSGYQLNTGQRDLARKFASGGHLVEAGVGPAGAGKTTAMKAFAHAVELTGGRVVGLGPSAAAAAALSRDLGGVQCDTLQKLLHTHDAGADSAEHLRLDSSTIVLVDEAGMASTPDLARLVQIASEAGASVRLLGDPAQLSAVGAGGALRLIQEMVGSVELDEIHRFRTAGEAEASLRVRSGDVGAADFYVRHHRTLAGSREAMIEEAYAHWWEDTQAGRRSIMIAPTTEDVTSLNGRARLERVATDAVVGQTVDLHDGNHASEGDVIVTRQNRRDLRAGATDFVKNGDLWTVRRRHASGTLRVRHATTGVTAWLPADYVAEHVELGYAATVNRVQGMTVDTAHALISPSTTREQLYTALTRGQASNKVYAVAQELLDVEAHAQPSPARAARMVLEAAIWRTAEDQSGVLTAEAEADAARSLARLVPAYEDAYNRVLDPTAAERAKHVAQAVLGEVAERVVSEGAWESLAARMVQHERAGHDMTGVLRDAVGDGDLQDAWSIAKVLHWRLGPAPVLDDDGRDLPPWLTPAPDMSLPEPPAAEEAEPSHAPAGDQQPASPEAVGAVAVNEAAWRWWQDQAATEGAWARDYLEGRGLGAATAGLAPAGWTGLVDALGRQGYTTEDMLTAGVATTTRDGRVIDRFRDRVVFPIVDADGQVVAVTARANPQTSDERTPKYLNSPEHPAYAKREVLYGLDLQARNALAQGSRPVLVEGPADVEAVRASGADVVPVAPCGTAVTEAQLDALRTAAGRDLNDLIVGLDPDGAGRAAMAKVWYMLDAHEAAKVSVLDLPEGADPADLVAANRTEELRQQLGEPGQLTNALLDHMLAEADLESAEGRVQAVRVGAAALARLPASPEQESSAAHLATSTADRVDPLMILDELVEAREQRRDDQPAVPAGPEREVDPEVAAWLNRQADLIAGRLDHLVDDAVEATPDWLSSLTPVPEQADEAGRWRSQVREVVAYRDRYGITGPDPLGSEDVTGGQAQARATAEQAVQALTPEQGRREEDPAITELNQSLASLRRRARAREVTREPEREPSVDPTQHDQHRQQGPSHGGPQI